MVPLLKLPRNLFQSSLSRLQRFTDGVGVDGHAGAENHVDGLRW